MIDRKYNLKLDLQFRCNNSNMEFNQFDKNTSDFFIQINRSGKEIDLSKALITLMVIKPDGNVDSQFLEVVEGGVYANLKPSLKDIKGDYQCKAIVTVKDATVIPEQIFTYTVNEDKCLASFNQNMVSNEDYTLLTDILGRLSTIETDEQQRQINEAERILNEESRKVAENTRVEAELVREHNDADREKAEAIRESNEFNRKTSESLRVEAEGLRVETENGRVDAETLRVEAEKLRNDNYSFMTSDEERRRSEENSRIEAENLRKQAESTRVNEESQRRTTEQARVLKEKERESKETERAANENTRKANESKRVQAETERVNRYDNFINDAESASNSFKAYTSTAKQEEETRKTNELARVKSEDVRVSNEVKRISDENTRKANEVKRVEAETVRQSKFNSKILEVDNKVVEVNVAKDTVIVDTKEAINTMKEDVANAIAAGTQDLEVKEARKDLKGKTHESLKLRIASDFEGLKESQDMSYETDKGYLVCKETKNGTIKDLKVSGKSLKNVCAKRDLTIEGDGVGLTHDLGALTEPIPNDVEYTVIVKVPSDLPNKNCFFRGYDKNGRGRVNIFEGDELYNNRGNVLVKKVTNSPNYDTPLVNVRLFTNATTGTFKLNDVMVIIGDHTQSPPNGYFGGIASVGNEVDKIEVSTVKADGNLFDIEKCIKLSQPSIVRRYSLGNRDIVEFTQSDKRLIIGDNFETNQQYSISFEGRKLTSDDCRLSIYYTDNTSDILSINNTNFELLSVVSKPNKTIQTIRSAWSSGKSEVDLNTISIIKSDIVKPYIEPQRDKKTILFKDTDGTWKHIKELRGLDTVCDTIELHNDGKYYYHVRTEKVILNGTSNYIDVTNMDELSGTSNYMVFKDAKMISNSMLCDKFTVFQDIHSFKRYDGECCFINSFGLSVKVLKTSLSTQDIEGFKQKLSSDNVVIIYELAEEKVFEVNPLFLEAFEGETMMSISSGVVNAPMEFKLTSSLPNLTRNLQIRIDNLENEIYKSQELQDIMLLENDLRLMDLEFALMESMPMKLNLRSDVMFTKGVTEFEFLKGRILSGSHTDEYLEKCINKYKKAGRLTDEEYDILYDMIYPPVYDVLADK